MAYNKEEIDYKELLKKYIEHVLCCEGYDFLESTNALYSDVKFTDKEKEALQKLR